MSNNLPTSRTLFLWPAGTWSLHPAMCGHLQTNSEAFKDRGAVPNDLSMQRNCRWGSWGLGSCIQWPIVILEPCLSSMAFGSLYSAKGSHLGTHSETYRDWQAVYSDLYANRNHKWGFGGLGGYNQWCTIIQNLSVSTLSFGSVWSTTLSHLQAISEAREDLESSPSHPQSQKNPCWSPQVLGVCP